MSIFIDYSIGPVQSFVAQSRRTIFGKLLSAFRPRWSCHVRCNADRR